MKKIEELIVEKVPQSFYSKKVGNGMCGNCFLTEDGRLFKEFEENAVFEYNTIKYICEIYSDDHLILPDTFVFLDENKKRPIGYLREYVDGNPLTDLPKNIDVRKFILAYAKLEKNIVENIKHGLVYRDLHSGNIIYTTNDELKVVDQDFYVILYESIRDIFVDVMYELHCTVIESMLSSYKGGNAKIDEIIKKSYYARERDFVRPSVMLELLVEHLEKEYAYNIKDCNDLDMGLKLSKGV